jgi:DNA modification methylase
MKISDIKPNKDNPRKIDNVGAERLAKSIEGFPQMMELRPIVVDDDGVILGGNMRYYALKKLGYKEIPDAWVKRASELTAVQKREFIIKDNGFFGEWDWDLLANEWDDLPLADWGLDLPEEWAALGNDEMQTDVDAEPQIDKAEELREKWGVETGQLWQLGDHLIYCGDSTDRDLIKELYGLEFADMVFTDPPYGTMATGRGGKSIAGDQTYNAVLGCFDLLPLVLKPGAPIYIMGGTFNLPMVYKLFDVTFRQVPTLIVWDKEQFVLRHHDYHNQWEAIFYSWRPCDGSANDRWHGDRKQSDVWRLPRDANSERMHITQKPVELVEKAVANSSPLGGIVWEPFSGSGATLIACERLGRKCRAVEISPAYCAVAIQRWADATSGTPELLPQITHHARAE